MDHLNYFPLDSSYYRVLLALETSTFPPFKVLSGAESADWKGSLRVSPRNEAKSIYLFFPQLWRNYSQIKFREPCQDYVTSARPARSAWEDFCPSALFGSPQVQSLCSAYLFMKRFAKKSLQLLPQRLTPPVLRGLIHTIPFIPAEPIISERYDLRDAAPDR